MTLRFCAKCAAEVEDVGGFCLLGHPLRLEAPIPPGADMRKEVDRALGGIRAVPPPARGRAGDRTLGPARVRTTPAPADAPPPPPEAERPRLATVWESLDVPDQTPGDPIEAFAPPPRVDWGPERSSLLDRSLRRLRRAAPA
jgi:hypothetical protein